MELNRIGLQTPGLTGNNLSLSFLQTGCNPGNFTGSRTFMQDSPSGRTVDFGYGQTMDFSHISASSFGINGAVK
jgi:hypothetical protein